MNFEEYKARLEDAAPDMLECLKWFETMLTMLKDSLPNPDTYESYMAEVRKIRSIIAKMEVR